MDIITLYLWRVQGKIEKTTHVVPIATRPGRLRIQIDGSGLDLRDYPVDPADRLHQDQTSVEEKLTKIEEQVLQQDNHISTEPVYSNPVADPAPASDPPSPPDSAAGGNSGGSSDSDDDSGSSESITPELVTLTMPQEDDDVNSRLARSAVSGVILRPGAARASIADLLKVDSGIKVPAGKTLTLQYGVNPEARTGQILDVAGTMTMGGGYLDSAGTVIAGGQVTVNGDFNAEEIILPFDSTLVKARNFYSHHG